MYCRNCAKELIGMPEFCLNCGARPLAGNSYCNSCASPTNALAEICIKCGTGLGTTARVVSRNAGKSKTASVLLAVFLAFWVWLYTYREDAWKFWVGLSLSILIAILGFATGGISFLFTWLLNLGVWIWAIVDVAVKNSDWYSYY